MATLRDVAAFAAKAVAAQAGMSLLGMNPGKKRKKDDTTKKALVIGTGLAMLKGAASAGAGMATKALATKAGMAMLGLNPRMSSKQLRTFHKRAKELDLARRKLENTLGKTVRPKTEAGRDLVWQKSLGGIKKQLAGIKRLELQLGIRRNPAMRSAKRPLSAAARKARQDAVRKAMAANRFSRTRIASPKEFDPRSFRTITPGSGRHKMVVACPKGQYKGGKCKTGMEVQSVMKRIFSNPRIQWVPFGRGYLYAVESFGGKYASWHWAVRRTNSIHGHAASGGLGHDSRAEAVAAAKDHITREMAREKHRKMWERKHGPTFGRNPLLMVVPNKGKARKGDPLVLKTANEGHGFFGTTASQYGQAVAEYAWDVVFKELLKGGWKPYTVRLFLDAKYGRHLADQVYIKGIPDKGTIRKAVLAALKSEIKWVAQTLPDMDAERKLGGVRWNPGKKISGNMISINLHRGGYPTLIHESAKWAIRKRDRGVWSPADYKNALLREWHNLGQGGGYSSGFTFQKKDPETGVVVELVETFNSPLAVFILTRKEAGANPGRTLVHGGKGRDSVVLGWKSKAEAKAYVRKKNRDGYIASVHPGRAGAPASARWVTISSRHKMFMKGPWAKNPGAAWHQSEAERMTEKSKDLERKGLMSMATKYRHFAGDQEYSAAHSKVMAMPNPSYLLTPRVRQLRTIATSGVPGRVGDLLVDGLKVDPVTARAVLKFLAAQTHNWADTLAKEPIGRLIQYAYKNAKKR